MRGRRLGILALVAIVVIAGSYFYTNLATSGGAEPIDAPDTPDVATQIAFWEGRIDERPGITSYTYLAEAHLRSARITGDLTAFQRAEAALDQALEINPNFRDAQFQMAVVRFSLHDFVEARAIAEDLASDRRPPAGTILLLSDIYLALGEYDLAEEALSIEHAQAPGPATLSRQAIIADLYGESERALELMQDAAEAARLNGTLPENRAWFAYQVGHLYLKSGKFEEAREWFERSDELLSGYYLARAGTAELLAATGEFDEAIASYEALIEAVPQPEYLAQLGDLYALQGNQQAAEQQYATVEFIAELGEGAYDRQFTLYLLDHDERLGDALAMAQQDVEARQDIYAWDTLAWALHKYGMHVEAAGAMSRALALGTADPMLHYHAGIIELALGNTEMARSHLERALAINPAFDLLAAESAAAALSELP